MNMEYMNFILCVYVDLRVRKSSKRFFEAGEISLIFLSSSLHIMSIDSRPSSCAAAL